MGDANSPDIENKDGIKPEQAVPETPPTPGRPKPDFSKHVAFPTPGGENPDMFVDRKKAVYALDHPTLPTLPKKKAA